MATPLNTSTIGNSQVSPIVKQASDELLKEIERVSRDRQFFGAITVSVNFQAGVPQLVRVDSSRTIR